MEGQAKHNHVVKVENLITMGIIEPRDIQYLTIRHDDTCALLGNRGLCDCDPDVELWEQLYENRRQVAVAFIPNTGDCGGGKFVMK